MDSNDISSQTYICPQEKVNFELWWDVQKHILSVKCDCICFNYGKNSEAPNEPCSLSLLASACIVLSSKNAHPPTPPHTHTSAWKMPASLSRQHNHLFLKEAFFNTTRQRGSLVIPMVTTFIILFFVLLIMYLSLSLNSE